MWRFFSVTSKSFLTFTCVLRIFTGKRLGNEKCKIVYFLFQKGKLKDSIPFSHLYSLRVLLKKRIHISKWYNKGITN